MAHRIISILYKMYTAANRSADSLRDIFFSTFMSRAFPATSLSTGYHVLEVCDLWKSDGVEFRREIVQTINRSEFVERQFKKIHSEVKTMFVQYDQLFIENVIQLNAPLQQKFAR